MSRKDNILKKVKEHIDEKFKTEDATNVPDISNTKLTFGNTGLKFDATVLYIDLRSSTDLINSHNKSTVAKIHKSFYYAIVKIAKYWDGETRSFNGDSLLVFFKGTTQQILSNAVSAALEMKFILNDSNGISKHLSKYTTIDFGIGLDYGTILSSKVGIGGTSDNKDLIWIGNAVNKSTKLSDKGSNPDQIYISGIVYDNLQDRVKYHNTTDFFGNPKKVDIWERSSLYYNGGYEDCYSTTYQINID